MRIGHVTYRYKPIVGGMETYVGMLFQVFQAAGHSQHIYQVDTGVPGQEFRFVPRPPLLPKQVGYNLGLLAQARNLAGEDRLIISNPEHYLPVAWHPSTIVLCHGATWTADASPRRRRLRRLAAEIAFRRARQWVSNDTFALRELGVPQPPRTGMFSQVAPGKWFIPNCVDAARFQRTAGRESLNVLQPILVPRNLTPPRGVDLAIRAFAAFVRQYPETNLVVVGDIIYDNLWSFRYKMELTRLINELDLVGKVFFLGSVPGERMVDVYSSALLTVIPTRASEGTSLAALESMACGTATLSTAVEGLLDLPTERCPPEPQAMAEAMLGLFPHREDVGLRQQQTVRATYNLQNWAAAWCRVLES
jgi:glycosyltransferase involved in cell wall biosynthesis